MNPGHMEYCASEDWRRLVHETILPVALEDVDLGDDAIEIGPGPGFTTDILRTKTAHLTAVELDEGLAAGLSTRMAETNVEVVVGDATALDFGPDRFTGAASFHMLHHIAPAEAQNRVFAELARVLVPGATLVAADGIYSEGSAAFHQDDTYNPIDPAELEPRLQAAGFGDVRVRTYDLGWVCTARLR
jgi:SAM-dependent methyltransferase